MADAPRPTPAQLARQAKQHLASLRAAGIDWLPLGPSPPPPPPAEPAANLSRPTPISPSVEKVTVKSKATTGNEAAQEERRQKLTVLAQKVKGCTRCAELASTRTQTVFGEGVVDPEICFIGEAPGADEDASGRPFVGRAGQLLTDIIVKGLKMRREDVYICNILRCRPPGNRTPLPDEAANCREYLEATLELVRPKFIVALGATAAKYLLNSSLSIGQLRGQFMDYRGIPVLCTYHPAYLLRTPSAKKQVWEDVKKLLAKMGRPVS